LLKGGYLRIEYNYKEIVMAEIKVSTYDNAPIGSAAITDITGADTKRTEVIITTDDGRSAKGTGSTEKEAKEKALKNL
jgi:hypothetical protein